MHFTLKRNNQKTYHKQDSKSYSHITQFVLKEFSLNSTSSTLLSYLAKWVLP